MAKDNRLIVACPNCRKKFRIRKPMRFKCRHCGALIDAAVTGMWEVYKVKEEKKNLPDSLKDTKEILSSFYKNSLETKRAAHLGKMKYFFYKIAYWYDNFISRGSMSMFITLLFMLLITLGICMILYVIAGYSVGIWEIFLQICDPGHMENASERPFLFKLIAVITSMLGVVIFSLVIAFLTNIFDQKLQELKKGHSTVLEENHTLILGWSDKVLHILQELIVANESEKESAIVILCSQEKEELEDYLRSTIKKRLGTRIIIRSGESSVSSNLEKVAISKCKSVIIVNEMPKNASKTQITLADTQIIKTVLTICKNPERRLEPFNIVTEMSDPRNMEIAYSIGEDELTVFSSNEIIAKILVQTSRQNGLATVYNELLSFIGHEIYSIEEPKLENTSFQEAIYHFPECVPIGIKQNGKPVKINPPLETIIEKGDEIVLIAEDDSTIRYKKTKISRKTKKLPKSTKVEKAKIEKQLLLGWNAKTENIIQEYGNYLGKGSIIDVVVPDNDREIAAIISSLNRNLSNITLKYIEKDYRIRQELEKINPFSYDNIIILASSLIPDASIEEIDSQTIYTLLLLRDMQKKMQIKSDTKLITEILNPSNQSLIQIAKVNDFVISNQLISMILAQVSEQKVMYEVYRDLFSAEGSEIYLKPATFYFQDLPMEMDFYDIMNAVMQRGEIAFGYRICKWTHRADLNFGIKLNPEKNKKIFIDKQDHFIVVSEDEF